MAHSEGMVAVVRSAESPGGLCVTLMEGNRQYTLMPNSEVPQGMRSNSAPYTRKTQSTSTEKTTTSYKEEDKSRIAYDSSVQAADGQYASIYKMAHCNLQPTSPHVELSEFPPQRPEVAPGQENFVIGGCGSGNASQSPIQNSPTFRIGSNWPNQAAPRAPRRPRRPDDAFASSLRNYPQMSPERSAEVIERLVNYSNMRNNKLSPERILMPKNHSQTAKCSSFTADQYQPIDGRLGRPRAGVYDESPTRDRWQYDEEKRNVPSRCDVLSMPEKAFSDFQRVVSSYPANLYPTLMESSNHFSSKYSNNMPSLNRHYSVNMETQAVVPTVSREMSTVPRPQPEVRNVAVFVSTTSSSPSSSDTQHRKLKIIRHSKSISIQTQISDVLTLRKQSVQTCFSSVSLRNNKKIRHKRKSKSQVELKIDDDLDDELVQIIQDLTKPTVRSKLKKVRKQKHDKHETKVKINKCENELLLFSERNLKDFTRELSNDLLSKIKCQNIIIQPTDLYRGNYFDLFKTNREQSFVEEILIEWLNDIPIKRTDYLGRPVIKEHILKTVGEKVQNILANKLKYISEASTKADIVDILEDMPIDVTGHTRRFFLNKLVTDLINNVKYPTSRKPCKTVSALYNYIQLTNEDVKQFIENEVTVLKRKFSLLICHDTVGHMINELTAVLLESMEAIKRGKINDVIDDVLTITSEFLTISEYQSIYFAHNLVYNLYHQFNSKEPHSCEFLCYSSQIQEKTSNNTNSSVENATEHENTANRSEFAGKIAFQVNEWLSSVKGIEKININSRLVVVNDLTGDIVDRQKYLEMNQSRSQAEEEELEHLKYQIFKWVNKALGENNLDTISKAPDLLARIKGVSREGPQDVPREDPQDQSREGPQDVSRVGLHDVSRAGPHDVSRAGPHDVSRAGPQDVSRAGPQPEPQEEAIVVMPKHTNKTSSVSQLNQSSNRPVVVMQSTTVPSAAQNKSINQLNEEFDAYVKDWVQRVPITFSKPEDEAIAEKARLGLYIGVWKAITKLKMSPETLDNPYHYQDALDDELEVLLQCLPQTPEFKTKKHVLKPELIEKTMIFNERVANVAGGSSYRQKLVNNVSYHLPKQTDINTAGKDADRLYEEWQKNMLAELYILYNRFKIDDRVKAIAYKKKLMRHVERMIDNIKASTKKGLKELDQHAYEDAILAALDEVPAPSDKTLNEEAGEILFLLEVEQWFRDLPLLPSERETAHMETQVFQNLLARKLYDIDAYCDPTKRADLMKQEIRRFLERLPLREEEKPNMNFMAEELLNRLNNVNSDIVAVGAENVRNSVNLLEGYDYEAFSRNLPVSSTFHGNPPRDPHDGSSYFVSEGVRVPDEQDRQMVRDPTIRSEQYLTIEGLTGPQMPSFSTSSAPPTPQNIGVPPYNQFQTPYQRPFQTEQTKNHTPPCCPGSGNSIRNGRAASQSIQIMEDPVSNLTNQNHSGYGPPSGGYDPNRLQPPPVDINEAAMPQQYRTTPMASSQRVDCCNMPAPQDRGVSGTPISQDNRAYQEYIKSISRPHTPQDIRTSGTCPMSKPQQSGTRIMPAPKECRASVMPIPQDDAAYSTSQLPSCCLTPSSGASNILKPQEQRVSIPSRATEDRSCCMPRPQSSNRSQSRTTEQGTNPIPRTIDSGTSPSCCKPVRRASAPPSYTQSRSPYQSSAPRIPDEYYTPYSTPDNEDLSTRNHRRERRDSARRKLRFEESDNDSDTDFGCRCMDKIWRCRRRKPLCDLMGYIPCAEMPCFMRTREPCYYRS